MSDDEAAGRIIRAALAVSDDPAFVSWARRWLSGEDRTYESALALLGQLSYGRHPGLGEVFGLTQLRMAVEYVLERTSQGEEAPRPLGLRTRGSVTPTGISDQRGLPWRVVSDRYHRYKA